MDWSGTGDLMQCALLRANIGGYGAQVTPERTWLANAGWQTASVEAQEGQIRAPAVILFQKVEKDVAIPVSFQPSFGSSANSSSDADAERSWGC